MTMQELMITPAYMRKQHDEISGKIAEAETALAQVDPMDVHSDLAKEKQAQLNGEMEKQLSALQSNGFNPTSKSDFIRLNKMYQQEVGPGGTLGKIQSAKKNWKVKEAEITANSAKMGHSPEATQDRINEAREEYIGRFNATGKVEDWAGIQAPRYEDLDADITQIKSMLGYNSKTDKAGGGYRIETDPETGMFVIRTQSGKKLTSDNYEQIEEAEKYLNNKWIKEGGLGKASAEWNNMSPDNIKNRINNGLGIMKMKRVEDSIQSNYQFKPAPGPTNVNGSNIISLLNTFTPEEFAYNDFFLNKNTFSNLEKNSGNLSKKQKIQYNKMKDFMKAVDTSLNGDSRYIHTKEAIEKLAKENGIDFDVLGLRKGQDLVRSTKYNEDNPYSKVQSYGTQEDYFLDGDNKRLNLSDENFAKMEKFYDKIEPLRKRMDEIRNDVTSKTTLQSAGYGFAPASTKEQSEYGVLNDNFGTAMKVGDFRNTFNIEGIDINEGIHRTALDTQDKNDIATMVRGVSSNSFKILSFIPKGASGLPEYIVEVQTKEGNKLNIDRTLRSEVGDGDNLGDGKAVTMRLSYKEDMGSGIKNINGLALSYLASKGQLDPSTGQTQGSKLAIEAKKAMYSQTTWAENGNRVYKDPMFMYGILKQISLDKSGVYDDILNNEEMSADPQKKRVALIQRYMEHFGDNLITF